MYLILSQDIAVPVQSILTYVSDTDGGYYKMTLPEVIATPDGVEYRWDSRGWVDYEGDYLFDWRQ